MSYKEYDSDKTFQVNRNIRRSKAKISKYIKFRWPIVLLGVLQLILGILLLAIPLFQQYYSLFVTSIILIVFGSLFVLYGCKLVKNMPIDNSSVQTRQTNHRQAKEKTKKYWKQFNEKIAPPTRQELYISEQNLLWEKYKAKRKQEKLARKNKRRHNAKN